MRTFRGDCIFAERRIRAVRLVILAIFLFLAFYLWRMQVLEGGYYYGMAVNNSVRLVRKPAPRGLIIDREGNVLVDNHPSFDIEVVPEDVEDNDLLIDNLSSILGLEKKEVKERMGGYRDFYYLPVTVASDVGMEKVVAIEERQPNLTGVHVGIYPRRRYVHGKTAAHLLGYIGKISQEELDRFKTLNYSRVDLIGKAGVEKEYERFLRGVNGGEEIQVDSRGYLDKVLYRKDPEPGCNIYLNLEIETQRAAESVLGESPGAVVALDPRSGEVLAMASSPAYDPNQLVPPVDVEIVRELFHNEVHPMMNRCIQGIYPPGSVFKVLVALAGLDSGTIEEDTSFECTGLFSLGRHSYRCWYEEGHGSVSIVDAIMLSCNVYFYNAGLRIGRDAIVRKALEFGVDKKTGIDLSAENAGIVPAEAWLKGRTIGRWNPGDTVVLAIGQGYQALTPMRTAVIMAAIANGGKIYKPRVADRVVSPLGDTIARFEPELMREIPLDEKNLQLVRLGLRKAVNSVFGTGRKAKLDYVEIAGKTGTVQVGPEGRRKNHSWFVGFAPYKDPRIVVAVLMEGKKSGGSYAAPAARSVFAAHLGKE